MPRFGKRGIFFGEAQPEHPKTDGRTSVKGTQRNRGNPRLAGKEVGQFAVAKVADFGIVDQHKVAAWRGQWTKPAFG